jgi:hypothetical protein
LAGGCAIPRFSSRPEAEATMRSILLWVLGVPIPIIILIAIFT